MHPNNRMRRMKYQVARYFGATGKEARFSRQLDDSNFITILRFLSV